MDRRRDRGRRLRCRPRSRHGEAADAVAAYLPHRAKPRSAEGLKKNLRLRDSRWFWHWDPAFLTAPPDDSFVRTEMLEQAAIEPAASSPAKARPAILFRCTVVLPRSFPATPDQLIPGSR